MTRQMAQHDTIIKFLRENPACSAKTIHTELKEKNQYSNSLRQLQRDLKELVIEGLVETHTIGREVVYSVSQSSTTTINDYFLTKIWAELFEIRKEVTHGTPAQYFQTFEELRTLVTLLPRVVKGQIMFDVERLKDYNFEYAKDPHAELYREELLSIVDKLSSLLHHYFTQPPKESMNRGNNQ